MTPSHKFDKSSDRKGSSSHFDDTLKKSLSKGLDIYEIPAEYGANDAIKYLYMYQKFKNPLERQKYENKKTTGYQIQSTTTPKKNATPTPTRPRNQSASNKLPLIREQKESPPVTKIGFRQATPDRYRRPLGNQNSKGNSSFEINLQPIKKNRAIEKLNYEFSRLKDDVMSTFQELKDPKAPKRVEKMYNKLNKTFDELQRRLVRQKPHLYNFEDYLASCYGKDYSIDEYAIALKAKPIEKKNHELKELIEQVQSEAYHF
jgi:hypothetical protein